MQMQKNKYTDAHRISTGKYYTAERNKQIIISLLKAYAIKRVIVSPGATNFALVGSMQYDSFFEMYSCVDERAAAYMAIGMATQTREPVVLSCTGATASRNYMPALTEAWKNNIPLLVITSSLSLASVGHLRAQVTDRAHSPSDMIYKSYQFDNIKDWEDEWSTTVRCNEALTTLLEVRKPILINVCTTYCRDFSVKELPYTRYIPTISNKDNPPKLPDGNIGIFIGSHKVFSEKEVDLIDSFCLKHNAVVFCDHTSGYYGNYKVNMTIPFGQELYNSKNRNISLLIHLGEISGDYYTAFSLRPKEVWRVNIDGAYVDFFHVLTKVFKMQELDFFEMYQAKQITFDSFYKSCKQESQYFYSILPETTFSNIWIARELSNKLPAKSQIHLGILNSLRSWNFFDLPKFVESVSNVGGFGIDGCVSSLVGAALVHPDKLYFGVVGDLAFYYDVNILLNNKLPNNVRLIIVNNGLGVEFRNYCHDAMKAFGMGVNSYVAAEGHFGEQTNSTVIDFCNNANIEYCRITCKEEFLQIEPKLLNPNISKMMVVEVITLPDEESEALKLYRQILADPISKRKRIRQKLSGIKRKIKQVLR